MALPLSLIINLILAITVISGIGYVILFLKPTKKVLHLRPRDHRGKTLTVSQETDLALTCKPKKGVSHWFIKYGPSYVFNEGGRMVTRFFGIEGTAYTAIAVYDELIKVSVKEFLEACWGNKFFKLLPEKQRKIIEEDRVGITIELQKIDAEDVGLPTLTSSDINDEGEQIILSKISSPKKTNTSQTIMASLTTFLLGAALAYFVVKQGYI